MKITLQEVRLSFPNLHKPRAVKEGDQPRFSAAFLLRKKEDKEKITELRNAIKAVAGEQWGAKLPKGIKFCVHDGAEKEKVDGYGAEVVYITASSDVRPSVVDRNKTPLVPGDPKPYAGSYVHAKVRLWAQDNSWGRRINAQLLGVQFVRDGEAFGEKPFDPEEEWEDLTEGEGDTDEKPAAKNAKAAPAEAEDDEIPF